MSDTHELKTWPEYFQAVKSGIKNFEVRENDRGFKVGDILLLKEYIPKGYSYVSPNERVGEYTGNEISVKVTYILSDPYDLLDFGVRSGYCVMSIEQINKQP